MTQTADSRYAWTRLVLTLALMTIGSSGMYVVSVVLPAVQAEFGVARADASLPYTLLMVGFGLLILTATPVRQVPGRLAVVRDRVLYGRSVDEVLALKPNADYDAKLSWSFITAERYLQILYRDAGALR